LQFHQEARKKVMLVLSQLTVSFVSQDDQFDMNLSKEEKEMKELMEMRQQKQKALIEQYELAMKNDIIWNEFLENINKLSVKNADSYEFKDLLHFYFSKSAQQVHHTSSSNSKPNQSRINVLNQFITDLLVKEHAFPYSYLQDISSVLHLFLNSLDKTNEIVTNPNLMNSLSQFETKIYNIIALEKNCRVLLEKQKQIFSFLDQQDSLHGGDKAKKMNLLNEQKNSIELILSSESKYQAYLPGSLFTSLNNCLSEIQEKIEVEMTQNKEKSNQQFILRKTFPYLLVMGKTSQQSLQQLKINNQKILSSLSNNVNGSHALELLNQMKNAILTVETILSQEAQYLSATNNSPYPITSTTEYIVNNIILKISSDVFKIISLNNQLINVIFVELFETILQRLSSTSAGTIKDDSTVTIFAMIVYGIYHELNKSVSLQKQFVKVLTLCFHQYEVLQPNFVFSSASSASSNEGNRLKTNEKLLTFYSCLLLYSNDNNNDLYQHDSSSSSTPSTSSQLLGPTAVHSGLQFLSHAIHQLYFLFHYYSTEKENPLKSSSLSEKEICHYLFVFLKYANFSFFMKYQKKYEEYVHLLVNLLKKRKEYHKYPVTKELLVLETFLETSLHTSKQSDKVSLIPLFFNYQNSYVVHSLVIVW
jgi:hypothetical protein